MFDTSIVSYLSSPVKVTCKICFVIIQQVVNIIQYYTVLCSCLQWRSDASSLLYGLPKSHVLPRQVQLHYTLDILKTDFENVTIIYGVT